MLPRTPEESRAKNFSPKELELLVTHGGKKVVSQGAQKTLWAEFANKISVLGVAHRTSLDIQKCWFDYKHHTKEKEANIGRTAQTTGGGPPPSPGPHPDTGACVSPDPPTGSDVYWRSGHPNNLERPSVDANMAGDGEILRMFKDLKNTIAELNTNYRERGLPVTDGSPELHRLCVKLEHLLQIDQKEKKSFFGVRRDYWDFFCHRLGKMKDGHKGVEFVSSVTELKTSTGRGRSFIRYCLARQQLAEALQLCFMEPEITREWYYARNPFLNKDYSSAIISNLYELNGLTFNLALKRADLDVAWPVVPGRLRRSSKQTVLNEEKGQKIQAEFPEEEGETSQDTRREKPQQPSASEHNNGRVFKDPGFSEKLSESKPKETTDYVNKLPFLEKPHIALLKDTASSQWEMPRQRHPGTDENLQHISSLSESLVASEKQKIELQRFNSELQSQTEKLQKERQSHLAVVQELVSAREMQEQSHSEERRRLQEELERDKERCTGQMEEQSKRVRELQDTNTFLNETLEELKVLINDLRQKLSEKEENRLRVEAEAELKNAIEEANAEGLAKLDKEHREKRAQYEEHQQEIMAELDQARTTLQSKEIQMNELISEHHQATREMVALAKSLEELAEKCKLQESERRTHLLESEAQQFRYQQLKSQCQILQEKLGRSEQKVEEQEELLSSLQADVTRLQVSEKQLEQQSWDNKGDKEPKLGGEQRWLEEELQNVQSQREKAEQKLEVCLMEKARLEEEKHILSETLLSHKQNLCSAKLDMEDLNKELISCHEQITSLKNVLDIKENTLKYRDSHMTRLQTALEDTTTKLNDALSEKSVTDAQLAKVMGERAELVNEKTRLQIQEAENVVTLEEALIELKNRLAALEEQMLKKEEEAVKTEELLKTTLQTISEEKAVLGGQLQSTTALLGERSSHAMRLKTEAEELCSSVNHEKAELGEKLANLQTERDAFAQQMKDLENKNLAASEDIVQFKCQVKKLELEKLKVKELLEKARVELEQAREQLSSALSERDTLKKKLADVASEMGQKEENSPKVDSDLLSELMSLREAKGMLEDNLLRMEVLEKEKKRLQEKLHAVESQRRETDESITQEATYLVQEMKNGPKHLERSMKEHLEMVTRDSESKGHRLAAKEQEVESLAEQLLRAKQDQESLKTSLEKEKQEAKLKEESYKEKLAQQNEMVQSMKGRVLQLLQEKDALWKKAEGISPEKKVKTATDPNACQTCRKEFKLLSKKYQCRFCNDTVCQPCSVEVGKKERYCLLCHQQRRHPHVT